MPGPEPGPDFTRNGWRRPGWTIGIVAALLYSACDERNAVEPPTNPAPTVESTATAPATERAAGPSLPELGTSKFRYEAGRLSVEANSAPRLPLLMRLAKEAEFQFQKDADDLPPLTIQFENRTLDEAIPLLMGDLSYQTEWVSDPQTRSHRLISLVVGQRITKTESSSGAGAGSAPEDFESMSDEEGMEVRIAVAEAIQQRFDSGWADLETDELLRRAADSDPEVRLRAAIELEPEEEGLERLIDLLAHDPDPRVRAASTASLENSDSFGAVEALLTALNDPNPEVVIEVIDSLEFAGDSSTIRHLEPLLAHRDSRVREAASAAIDFLGD